MGMDMATIADRAFDIILLLVFITALLRYLRSDRTTHVEIPLMLGALAGSLVLPDIGRLIGVPPGILSVTSGVLFLAQPYLLLRVASRFTRVNSALLWSASAWLLLSCIVLVLSAGGLRAGAALLVIAYYVVVDTYAVFLFLRESFRTRGVVRRRMLAIALGTGAIVLALLAAEIVSGPTASLGHLLATIVALAASAGYVVGFTPPAWLQHSWQLPEIDRFIRRAPQNRDVHVALEHLARTALRITGAIAVAVVDTSVGDDQAIVQWYGQREETLPGPTQFVLPREGILASTVEGSPGVSRSLDQLPNAVRSWAVIWGVQEFTAIPIRNQDRQAAFLLVFANHGFLFVQDNIDLLGHLARHTAIACENARLLSEAKHEAHRLTAINRVMAALIRPMDQEVLAREMLDVLADAMGAAVAELFVLEPDGMHLTRIARIPEGGTAVRWLMGMGLPGQALQQGAVVFCPDVRGDPRFVRQEEAEREGYRSLLAVPLIAGERKVGVYTLLHKIERSYTPSEIEMLRELAAPITTALHNAILHRTAEHRLLQFQLLHETSLALTSELSMEQLLTQITDAARRLTGSRYAALSILGDAGQVAQFVTSGLTETDGIPGMSMPTAKGLLGAVLQEGRPLRVADIAAHPRAIGIPPGHPPMRSFLGVPIAYHEEILGMLYVTDSLVAEEFSAEDEWAIQGLAAHAAVAINNASLFVHIDEARSAAERANTELEQASRAKSDFLASMSHELRTPLNAILGFTEIMLDDDSLDAERRHHFLSTVHSSGRHLLGLINDILDLSKVEAGQMDVQIEEFDAVQAVQEVLEAVQPLAAQGGVDLVLAPAKGVHIQADRGKFKQILYNLVSNAIKFTEQGGQVLVETQKDADNFTVAVEDTGIGIAPEDQERIFDAFQQVDSSSDRRYKGTGLGLALVRRFVELHGGQVTLQSTPGRGSRFHVFLPGAALSEAPAAAQDEPANGDGPLVLIVEDDARAEALLRYTLQSNGFRTASARSGEEALVKAKVLHPVAVTLDVMLPGIDGWAVLQMLKSDPETRAVPVAVVTVIDDQKRAYALGAADLFVKPVDRGLLLDCLRRYAIPPASGVTVLAVDPEPSALELIAGILREEGYLVVEAHDGPQALEAARESPPDIVILDLIMLSRNGFDLLSELRRLAETSHVPVLVVTARELTEDDKQNLSGQVLAVLRKGEYGKSDLIRWIHAVLPR